MRKKWNLFAKLGVVLTSLFATFVITSANTSAFNLGSVSQTQITTLSVNGYYGSGTPWSGSQSTYNSPTNRSLQLQVPSNNLNSLQFSDINLTTTNTGNWPQIPAHSVFPLQITYFTNSNTDEIHFGRESFPGLYLLNKDCFTNRNMEYSNFSAVVETTCTYWLYTPTARSSIQFLTDTMMPVDGFNVVATQRYLYSLQITDESGGGGSSGLTEAQLNGDFRTWLQSVLSTIHAEIYNTNDILDDIRGILEALDVSQSEIQDTLDDIVANQQQQWEQDQQDRQDIQDQQDDISDSSDDSQSDAQSTGTTLLSAFSAFVTALTNANPSNCNIDMDLGNLDLGVVNFCQLSPPAGFSTLSSIFMILFCVPLSIATARKVINLFRSFQT